MHCMEAEFKVRLSLFFQTHIAYLNLLSCAAIQADLAMKHHDCNIPAPFFCVLF